jgi:exo-beta-1,3-glucanase (GH17 family)
MSYRSEHKSGYTIKNTTENPLSHLSENEILQIFKDILAKGVHGFCFSLYEDGQKPGDLISEAQIRRRMEILRPHTRWIRSFSTTESNDIIPRVAKEYGLKTLVGAWIGKDEDKNHIEVDNLIQLAKDGLVDIAAVGNEVLYRNDISLDQLLAHIRRVKNALPDIPVGYVDAYYEFSQHPVLTGICDVILCNCYPFWEGTPFEASIDHMQQMYQQTKAAAGGKKVIITETGWPTQGESLKAAVPWPENALQYFIRTQMWVESEGIESFYFSSFDESWKVSAEGEVGAYWGIWDKHEKLKYVNS